MAYVFDIASGNVTVTNSLMLLVIIPHCANIQLQAKKLNDHRLATT